MKDASGLQTQEVLSIVPQRPHRHPLAGPPVLAETKDNTVLCPEPWPGCHAHCYHWPFPPRPVAVRAPAGPRILHATPSLRYAKDKIRRGRRGKTSLRFASLRAMLRNNASVRFARRKMEVPGGRRQAGGGEEPR